MRRRPTEDESKDFKSRVRFLVAESGNGPGWWEANKGFARGEVQNWCSLKNTRGARPGFEKYEQVAEAFGVELGWIQKGKPVHGRVFLDDPTADPMVERLERLEEAVTKLRPPKDDEGEDADPASNRRPTAPPAKKAETDGRKRPR